jgi:hypothetical protein
MKYRKKPVEVEAFQWFEEMGEMPEIRLIGYREISGEIVRYDIKTLEGWMRVTNGDWIITGVKGEKYPCKADIFEMTCEKVNEG